MTRLNEPYYKQHAVISGKTPCWHNVKTDPRISVHGLYNYAVEPIFKRMPDDIAKSVSERVAGLYTNTAGGRIRFKTDSRYLALRCMIPKITQRPLMSLLNSAGFDVYFMENGVETYWYSFYPPIDLSDTHDECFEGMVWFENTAEREITVYMPLYNDVADVFIGIAPGASLEAHRLYTHSAPILYYGSSITQGASVSRPGMAYQAQLSRRFDADFINLGFASGACGEESIINYMATLDFDIFVSDYDYNAPNAAHLRNTHSKLYRAIRNTHPNTPYVMLSKPILNRMSNTQENRERRGIVENTYREALDSGDKNVWFIDGFTLFKGIQPGDICSDGVHPNDLGAYYMANAIGDVFDKIYHER